jgi:hypothetical protein
MAFKTQLRGAVKQTLIVARNLIDAAIDYIEQTEADETSESSGSPTPYDDSGVRPLQ